MRLSMSLLCCVVAGSSARTPLSASVTVGAATAAPPAAALAPRPARQAAAPAGHVAVPHPAAAGRPSAVAPRQLQADLPCVPQ